MVSNFKSDRQRKKVMAELSKNQPRSQTRPTIIGRIRAGEKAVAKRIRKRFRPTTQELAEQRGARIKKEAEELKEAKRRTRQLELEAQVESEREFVRRREEKARQKLKEIDIARRERTFAGRVLKAERRIITRGVEAVKERISQRPRKRARRKPKEETGFFGIK